MNLIAEYIKNIELNTNLSKNDILEKVKEKKEKNKVLTDIGSLYMIKKELGLDFSVKYEFSFKSLNYEYAGERDFESEDIEYYRWKSFMEDYPNYEKEDLRDFGLKNILKTLNKFLVDYLAQYTHDTYKINDYITIKLQLEKSFIYVGNELLEECLFSFLKDTFKEGIDIIAILRFYDKERHFRFLKTLNTFYSKRFMKQVDLDQSIQNFIGLCSTLKNWEENKYDTNLIDSILGLSLLKKCVQKGISNTEVIFQNEIIKQLKKEENKTSQFIVKYDFLKFLTQEMLARFFPKIIEQSGISQLYLLKNHLPLTHYEDGIVNRAEETFFSMKKKNMEYYDEYIDLIRTAFNSKLKEIPISKIQELIADIYHNVEEDFFYDDKDIKIASITFFELTNADLIEKYKHDRSKLYIFIKKCIFLINKIDRFMDIDVSERFLSELVKFCNNCEFTTLISSIEYALNQAQNKTILDFLIDYQFFSAIDKGELERSFQEDNKNLKEIFEKLFETSEDYLPIVLRFVELLTETGIQSIELLINEVFNEKGVVYNGKLIKVDTNHRLSLFDLDIQDIFEIKGLDSLINLKRLSIFKSQISEIKGLDSLINLESLNLSHNQITEIKGLDCLANLKTFDLSDNKIKEIKGLDSLINLKRLLLYGNQITEIEGLDSLTNLESLNLSDNQITEIKGLDCLANLKTFDLSDNKIKEIKGLDSLINLSGLVINNNQINKISGLESLKNLTRLELKKNQITEVEAIEHLESFRYLNLDGNRIKEIKGLDSLSNLKHLTLRDNQINEIKGLDSLINLKELYLSNNLITEFKNLETLLQLEIISLSNNQIYEIQGLELHTKLKKLDLSGNPVAEILNVMDKSGKRYIKYCRKKKAAIKKDITIKISDYSYKMSVRYKGEEYKVSGGQLNLEGLDIHNISEIEGLDLLVNLNELNLSGNRITEINGLETLINLDELKLYNNLITEIKGLNSLADLEKLDLDSNQITENRGLQNLIYLNELNLSFNRIDEISGLEKLTNLKELIFQNNHIIEIKGLENLNNLEVLNLKNNNIKEIQNLENLVNLKELNLRNNQITEIKGLNTLTELKKISLTDNPIIYPSLIFDMGNDGQQYVEYCRKKS